MGRELRAKIWWKCFDLGLFEYLFLGSCSFQMNLLPGDSIELALCREGTERQEYP